MKTKPSVKERIFVKTTAIQHLVMARTEVGNEYIIASLPLEAKEEAERRVLALQNVMLEYGIATLEHVRINYNECR